MSASGDRLRAFVHDRWRLLAAGGSVALLVGIAGGWLLTGGLAEPNPTPVAVATPTPSASASPTARPTPSSTPTPTPTPSPTPQLDSLADGRLTVLVLGSDSNVERRRRGKAFLTDAITVVSLAADGSKAALISLPRDTVDLPMADGSTWSGKANALAVLRSPAVMRDTMATLLDLPIDHYLLVDMDDFVRIVDAAGGVTVSLPYGIADKRCSIGAGTQELSGELALCFARHRATDSDYARAGRHQQLLLALRDRVQAAGLDLPALVGALGSLQTDIPASAFPAYLQLLLASADADVETMVLSPPQFTTFAGEAGARGWISIPNVPAIRGAVASMTAFGD